MTNTEGATLEERLDGLLDGLASVHTSIDQERDARLKDADVRDKENVSRDKKSNRIFAFAVVSGIVGLVGVIVGVLSLTYARQIVQDRTSARIVACQTTNDTAKKFNGLVDADVTTLQDAKGAIIKSGASDEQKQAAIAFYDQRIAGYEANRQQLRDCSAEAVNAFYK